MKSLKYNHNELKGREFKSFQDGFDWYFITSGQGGMFCKMNGINYSQAKAGNPFEVWHMCIMTDKGLAPLCANTKTLEPWLIGGYANLSELHPNVAKEFEAAWEDMTRAITVATAGQLDALTKKPMKIELVD